MTIRDSPTILSMYGIKMFLAVFVPVFLYKPDETRVAVTKLSLWPVQCLCQLCVTTVMDMIGASVWFQTK